MNQSDLIKLLLDLEKFYLEYTNNFLTITKVAEYYGLTFGQAYDLIEMGRKINNEKTYDNLFKSEK